MNFLAILALILGVYLLLKMGGFIIKAVLIVLVLAALYWLAAPYLGAPALY
jgi:hypothetical protein